MDSETARALIGIAPQLLLILIVAIVLLALRRPVLEKVLPRVSKVSLIGIQVDLQPAEIRQALVDRPDAERRPLPDDAAIGSVAERARRNAVVLNGRVALWIDDHPEWTQTERFVLHGIGLFVEAVRNTEEARSVLDRGIGGRRVELIVSDIRADDGSSRLAEVVQIGLERSIPVIFYVAEGRDGVPPGAFGLTTKPDELWHLAMDALERFRAEP